MRRLRFLFAFCFLISAAARLGAEPLQICVMHEGSPYPLVAVKEGRLLIEREGKQMSVSDDSRWALPGDPAELRTLAAWSPGYGILRSSRPDLLQTPEPAWRGVVNVNHQEGIGPLGKEVHSEFLKNWPDALHEESALVAVWLAKGRPSKVQVRALPALRDGFFFRTIRFQLDEQERSGQPVVLVWQQGRFLPVLPRFPEPHAQAAYLAVLQDDARALEPLLARPELVKATDATGYTLLHFAAEAGAVAAARRLITAGAAVDARTKEKETPLHGAAAYGRAEIVSLLLEKKARPDLSTGEGITPLHAAAGFGHTTVVKTLIETRRVKVDRTTEERRSALGMALTRGYADIARLLAPRDSTSVDFRDEHAARVLVDQAGRGRTALVRLMIEHKTPVDQLHRGRGALAAAAWHDDVELIDALLAAGAPPDHAPPDGITPLMIAARAGHTSVVRRLLAAGASAKRRESNGKTPLHHAVFGDNPEVVALLLEAGAAVDAATPELPSPLALALLAGSQQVLPALEAAGVIHLWSEGTTGTEEGKQVRERLLFLAIASDHDGLVKSALNAGWSADARLAGWPLLRLARIYGARRCTELLVGRGAAADEDAPISVVGARQLDALPRALRVAVPPDPRDAAENFPAATVKVDFILGPEGEVLFPRVLESPDVRLNLAVLTASPGWRFSPPRSEGRMVASRTVLPVVYPSSADRPYSSGDVDEMASVLTRSAPVYPFELRASGETGRVDIQFEVSPEGVVENIQVIRSSNPHFEASAIAAVRQWRFRAAARDGMPVRVKMVQPMTFELRR